MSANDEAEDARLLSVAESIAEGTRVDWNDVDKNADPTQQVIVDELKALEEFARRHDETPTSWGSFSITAEIARGAFGTVYFARDAALDLDVALKVIRPRNPGLPIDPAKALKEGRLLAKITHPNVVRVFRVERVGEEVGLAMELIHGQTLHELVQTRTCSASEATLIGLDLCRALAAVHRSGALHGDIKAHNVMRGEGGRIVLMDFGAGKDLNLKPRHGVSDFAGTPLYLAPEVFAGSARSKASDIYSLGVLLYYLVSGSYPVEGTTRTEVEQRHDRPNARIPLRDVRPDLPEDFIHVVDRALAERPADRYRSAGEFEEALAKTLPFSAPVTPSFPWKMLSLVASVVLVLGLGGAALYQLPLSPSPDLSVANSFAPVTPVPSSSANGEYRIRAAFYREQDGAEVRVQRGTRLAPADKLSLDVEVSVPAHLYIVSEDEHGVSNLLFPLPGQTLTNPLPAGRHRLPGMLDGEKLFWQVTSVGGHEHFVIIASPARSSIFEALFATLPRPTLNAPVTYARLSKDALGVLRSVGGLATATPAADTQLRLTPEFAIPLTGAEETTRGVWIRQATLANPEQ